MKENVVVGLIGMGVVGGGVARVVYEKAAQIENLVGNPVLLKKVLVRNKSKARSFGLPEQVL